MDTEQNMEQALRDISVTPQRTREILDAVQNGEREKAKQLLLSVRCDILSELHINQNKLYRLDYILRSLK